MMSRVCQDGLRAENEEGDDTGGPRDQIEGGNPSWAGEVNRTCFENRKKEEK